jgi:hypothetical protein
MDENSTIGVINKYYEMTNNELEQQPTIGRFRFVKQDLKKMRSVMIRRDMLNDIEILKEYIKQRKSIGSTSYNNDLLTISTLLIPEIDKFIPKLCDDKSDEYYGGRKSRRKSKKSRKSRKSRR